MSKFSLLNRVTVVTYLLLGKLDSNFLFAIFQKTIHGTLIHGQTSTKYANLGLFRHPCPTLSCINIFVNCFQQENEKQGRSNRESLEPPTKTSLSSINSIGASSDRHDGAQSLNNIFKGFQNEAYNSSPVRKVSF